MASGQPHPYFPPDAVISGYAPNTTPLLVILPAFGGLVSAFVLGCVGLARRYNPGLKWAEQLTVAWFALCGFLHLFFEGYFVLNHATLASSQSLFAQLWKEYSLSDSRYLTSDPFMLCIETLTVITWAPLSLLTAYFTATNPPTRRLSPQQVMLQTAVCVGHLYGVALYYGTCAFAEHMRGVSYSRPEGLYYWGYYVGMNAPWVVVPLLLLRRSWKARAGGEFEEGGKEGKKER